MGSMHTIHHHPITLYLYWIFSIFIFTIFEESVQTCAYSDRKLRPCNITKLLNGYAFLPPVMSPSMPCFLLQYPGVHPSNKCYHWHHTFGTAVSLHWRSPEMMMMPISLARRRSVFSTSIAPEKWLKPRHSRHFSKFLEITDTKMYVEVWYIELIET